MRQSKDIKAQKFKGTQARSLKTEKVKSGKGSKAQSKAGTKEQRCQVGMLKCQVFKSVGCVATLSQPD